MRTGTIVTKTLKVEATFIDVQSAGVFYRSQGVDKFVPMHMVTHISFNPVESDRH